MNTPQIMKRGQRPYLHWVILRGFNPLIASRVPNPIRSGTCGSPGLPGKSFGDLLDKSTSQIHLNTTWNIIMSYISFGKVFHFIHPGGKDEKPQKKSDGWTSSEAGVHPEGLMEVTTVFDTQSIAIMALGQPRSSKDGRPKVPRISQKWGMVILVLWFASNIRIPKDGFFSTRICSMGRPYPLGDWQLQCRPWCHTCIHVEYYLHSYRILLGSTTTSTLSSVDFSDKGWIRILTKNHQVKPWISKYADFRDLCFWAADSNLKFHQLIDLREVGSQVVWDFSVALCCWKPSWYGPQVQLDERSDGFIARKYSRAFDSSCNIGMFL